MSISRRQALGTIAGSVVAAGAACANPTDESKTTAQSATPPASPPAPATELRIVFTGLQLFVVEPQKPRIVVAMPKAARGVAAHVAQLAVIGGAITTPANFFSTFTAAGLPTHAVTIDGYRLTVDGGAAGALSFDKSAAKRSKPANADQWKSLRHIPEFNRLHPKATLKSGWDTGAYCQSMVEITSGQMAALPGFDYAIPDTILKGDYFSHYSTLRVPSNGKVKLRFDSLIGGPARDVEITADNTGPLVAFLTFAPAAGGALDHGTSIEAMFDGVDPKVTLPMSSTRNQPRSSATTAPMALTVQSAFGPMFDLLSDGTPSCPPFSFWA